LWSNYLPGSIYVAYEVITAVLMKRSIFWDTTLCSPLKVNRRFRGTCRFSHKHKYKFEAMLFLQSEREYFQILGDIMKSVVAWGTKFLGIFFASNLNRDNFSLMISKLPSDHPDKSVIFPLTIH
jgi:hypothetical protein